MTTTLQAPNAGPGTTTGATRPGTTVATRPGTSGQVVVDGALLLPRTVLATRALLAGEGVDTYRSAFPVDASPDGLRRHTTSPSRIATHVVAGLVLGLATVAVLVGLVLALLVSPLLLAPAGGASLLAFAGIGGGHRTLTRRLVDRS